MSKVIDKLIKKKTLTEFIIDNALHEYFIYLPCIDQIAFKNRFYEAYFKDSKGFMIFLKGLKDSVFWFKDMNYKVLIAKYRNGLQIHFGFHNEILKQVYEKRILPSHQDLDDLDLFGRRHPHHLEKVWELFLVNYKQIYNAYLDRERASVLNEIKNKCRKYSISHEEIYKLLSPEITQPKQKKKKKPKKAKIEIKKYGDSKRTNRCLHCDCDPNECEKDCSLCYHYDLCQQGYPDKTNKKNKKGEK